MDELKFHIVSYIADAPFESLPENYPKLSLMHVLPFVSKTFKLVVHHVAMIMIVKF